MNAIEALRDRILNLDINGSPLWFVTATGDGARALCEGKWINAYDFRADDGIREIHETLFKLNPDHAAKEEEWNKADGPQANELFPVIDEKMVA